ncbi:MAG TPA: GNAT family protein [Actinomycetes bacterium]|nr:GNAT family protein [Actinomycetes bacterium]
MALVGATGWPAKLSEGRVRLRPIQVRDAEAWYELRARNHAWLSSWEATTPGGSSQQLTFKQMVRRLRREARAGRVLPFAVLYEGKLVGQLTVANIIWGSVCSASMGYWVDQRHAGRGIIPTAVALAADHCFKVVGLHRMEVAIRPENHASLRVVEKLGFRSEGLRPKYLHIDGEWRDHLLFALNADEVPEGLLARWKATRMVPP